jgi:hypothetical protein
MFYFANLFYTRELTVSVLALFLPTMGTYVWPPNLKRHLKSKHDQERSTLIQQQPCTYSRAAAAIHVYSRTATAAAMSRG